MGETLTADGASLGSDDGSGVAIIMSIVQGNMDHGPLRVLITVDEEDGMDGAFSLDVSHLQGAKYLLNIDNEESSSVLVSTAAGDSVRATGSVSVQSPTLEAPLAIQLSGLKGGHSGVEIDKGRLNAIIGMARLLGVLADQGIDFELASLVGGTAGNAIPSKAEAVIVVSADDRDKLVSEVEAYKEKLEGEYAGIESAIKLTVQDAQMPEAVVSPVDRDAAMMFCTQIVNGVYTMSADMEGLVESSSNLGIFSIDADGVLAPAVVRSSVGMLQTEIVESQESLAGSCGYDVSSVKTADPWAYNPDSELLALYEEAYKEATGEDVEVIAVHGGLECGRWAVLNPDLDMVSVGPDISGAHSPEETLYLDSVAKLWHVLELLLTRLQ